MFWTIEEDKQLRTLVHQLGYEWNMISVVMKTREPKQCRERWINVIDPGLKHGPLDKEEWAILSKQRALLGNAWSLIAKYIPGRSPNQVKNAWHSQYQREGMKRVVRPMPFVNFKLHNNKEYRDIPVIRRKKSRKSTRKFDGIKLLLEAAKAVEAESEGSDTMEDGK